MKKRTKYLTKIQQIPELTPDRERLEQVSRRYAFRLNDYYLNLINWDDPDDPIRNLVIPSVEELDDWGELDASNEGRYTVARGLQHKYPDTALLLCTENCAAYCRYCFRKRLFMKENEEIETEFGSALDYIARNKGISNVLFTGGDPLMLSPNRLAKLVDRLRSISHVKILRFGTKTPAFDPERILSNKGYFDVISSWNSDERRVYFMAHFDHPREFTDVAAKCIKSITAAGAVCVNQCPIIKGVNDDAVVLESLFKKASLVGCPQYYVFQGRPTAGNQPFSIPLARAYQIFSDATANCSGLSRRARFVLSHEIGKIELVGTDATNFYMKIHRSPEPSIVGEMLVANRSTEAFWLDDLSLAKLGSAQVIVNLSKWSVKFRLISHESIKCKTGEGEGRCAEASSIRGLPLEAELKTILFKLSNGEFIVCSVPATCQIDSKKVRALTGYRSRFANDQELHQLGVEQGTINPFTLTKIRNVVDTSILAATEIGTNAGCTSKGVLMHGSELKKIPNIEFHEISKRS